MCEELKVSPRQFAILTSELILAELAGNDPKTCSKLAFKAAGLKVPKRSVEIGINHESTDV